MEKTDNPDLVNDDLRRELEEAQAEIERLRHERRMFRRRLVECLPWVGRAPYPNTQGCNEMFAILDLAKDALKEVPE